MSKTMAVKYELQEDTGARPDEAAELISWLGGKSPDVWHFVARKINWSGGLRVLDWIVSQPECDKATAAYVFWFTEPEYQLSVMRGAGYKFNIYALFEKVLANWQSGFYRRQEIALSQDEIGLRVLGLETALANLPAGARPFVLPRDLCGPFRGREPDIPYDLRVEHNAELRRLLNALGGNFYSAEDEAARAEERRRDSEYQVAERAISRQLGHLFDNDHEAAAYYMVMSEAERTRFRARRWVRRGLRLVWGNPRLLMVAALIAVLISFIAQ